MNCTSSAIKIYASQSKRFADKKGYTAILIIISAFGPYVSKGIGLRLEHFFIYPLFLLSLIKVSTRPELLRVPKTLFHVIWLLVIVTLWTMIVTLLLDRGIPPSKLAASAENYIQPIVLIWVLVVTTSSKTLIEKLIILEQCCIAICVMLSLNTIVAAAQIFTNTWPFVQYFIRAESLSDFSVWRNAISVGRYSGVFNQPFEAGLAYSIGLGAWLYLFEANRQLSAFKLALLAGLLIGGSLSVSKVFILGGIPLSILYLLLTSSLNHLAKLRFFAKSLLFSIIMVPSSITLMREWKGSEYFLRLFNLSASSENLLSLYTSGRFGVQDTDVKNLFLKTMQESPIHGFGFGFFSAVDNAYIEFFYQGGFIGIAFYTAILLVMIRHAFHFRKKRPNEGRLLAFLIVIVIGAGIGAPVLTINRSSIFLWTLIVLAVSISSHPKLSSGSLPKSFYP